MLSDKEYEELYRLARNKLEEQTFYIHLVLFIIFNAILIIIWRFTGVHFPWFVVPLGLWGILMLFHFVWIRFLASKRKPGPRMERAIGIEIWKVIEEKKRKEGKTTEENAKEEKSNTDVTSLN